MSILRTLTAPFRRHGSIEDPAVPLSSRKLAEAFGIDLDPAAGVSVSERSALGISAVWAAVNLLAGCVGILPVHLYRRLERGRDRVTEHPAVRLLSTRPNPEQTPQTFREMVMANALLYARGAAVIVRDAGGDPVELLPMPGYAVEFVRKGGGGVYLRTHHSEIGTIEFRPTDYLHIPGLVLDGVAGTSPIRTLRRPLSIAQASEEFQASFFAKGIVPSGFLKHPGTLSDPARENLVRSWQQVQGGARNAFKLAVLEEGVEWQTTALDPEKAQMHEARSFTVSEVARIFGVPPHMIADLSRATFSNIEHQTIQFVTYSLQRWVQRFEHEFRLKLLREREIADHYWKFNLTGLLRGDSASRSAYYRELLNVGVLNINDVRELEDMNPIGPEGDVHRIQLAMAPATEADAINAADGGDDPAAEPAMIGAEDQPDPDEDGERAAADQRARESLTAAWFTDAAERVVRRHADRLERLVSRRDPTAAEWPAAAGETGDGYRAALVGDLGHVAARAGIVDPTDPEALRAISAAAVVEAEAAAEALQAARSAAIEAGKAAGAVDPDAVRGAMQTELEDWRESRGPSVARSIMAALGYGKADA